MGAFFRKYAKGDRVIWLVIVTLSIASLLSVYSATGLLAYRFQDGNTSYYMFRQFISLAFGIGVILFVHRLPYTYIARFAYLALWFSVFLLMVTLVAGVNLNNAARWLTLPVIGITFQPSEIAKLAIIIYVAKILARYQKEDAPASEAFLPALAHVVLVAGLIFTENLSTALLVVAVTMSMMFVGRVPFKFLAGTGFLGIGLLVMVILIAPKVSFLPRAETWASRAEQFFNPNSAERGDSFQADQSKIAIASGGLIGKGPGNSVQRNFLPHPYSDFIFAIIAEEYGLVGAGIIIACYLLLLARIGILVRSSTRTFPAFMALGLGLMMVSQAFINMGVAVGIFPVTGQPLPLVSLGTTSVLFTCVAFGLILGVSRHNQEQVELARQNGNSTNSNFIPPERII